MATKIIKAWVNGVIKDIEVEDIALLEQPLSLYERVEKLEDKPIITDGNLLVGNGTKELEEMTPEEVLEHINGASVMALTTAEYEAIEDDNANANTLYLLTDSEDEEGQSNIIVLKVPTLENEEAEYTDSDISSVRAAIDKIADTNEPVVILDYNGAIISANYFVDNAHHYFIGFKTDKVINSATPLHIICIDYDTSNNTLVIQDDITLNGDFVSNVVRYDICQNLTDNNQKMARKNIGVVVDDVYDLKEVLFSATWDGDVSNKDSFESTCTTSTGDVYGSGFWVKISDEVPDFNLITDSFTTIKYYDDIYEYTIEEFIFHRGENCYCTPEAIVVTNAGECKIEDRINLNHIETFTAPSTGVYFWTHDEDWYLKSLTLYTERRTGMYLSSDEKNDFVVGVADNGAIITKASDGTIVEMATSDKIATLESQIADLLYKAITITSFKNNGNTTTTVEKGSIIADVTLTWATSKAPKTLTLDGNAIDVSTTSVALTNLSITSDKTWTLKATDERNAVATKTTKIAFVHGVYYGVVDSGVTVNSSVIHNLVEQNKLTKSLQSSKSITFAATANAGQHIMFAMPTNYGTPMFKDKDTGFEAGFYKANTITFTNSNDYDESYDIWLSTNTGLGTMNVIVS